MASGWPTVVRRHGLRRPSAADEAGKGPPEEGHLELVLLVVLALLALLQEDERAAVVHARGVEVERALEDLVDKLAEGGGVRVDAAPDAAARAGIREGDLILAIANTEVTSLKEFELIMSRVDKTRPTSVLIRRGDGAQYVLIRPVQ